MRKIKKLSSSKAVLFAGAAALMALAPNTHAQSSVESLLNKLEQKGVLTADEAKALKAENQQDIKAAADKTSKSGFTPPDWVTGYNFSGDLRGRFDDMNSGNPAVVDRIRLRYRLRVGLQVNMKNDLEVGLRVGSGDGGQPLSGNQTMSGNASKKTLYVDTAYGKWTPIHDDGWTLAATFGKMVQPFDVSPMLFAVDYTPEGGALQATYKFNDDQSLRFNTAAFVLDELQYSSRDPFLYGGQVVWDARWSPKVDTSLGVAAYNIVNVESLLTNYDTNVGNTISGGHFVHTFNPVVVSGSATYTLDSFPLYTGAFPVTLAGEYMNNPAVSDKNRGWWGGATFGKSGKKGQWDLSYRYQYLGADAWWDQLVDDNNVAAFPTASVFGTTSTAFHGGTDIRGHLIKFNYSIFDSLTFSFTCYLNGLISNPVPGAKTDGFHTMTDIMWKF
jgi:Putative porin